MVCGRFSYKPSTMPKYNPSTEAKIVTDAIKELASGDTTFTLLQLHPDTAQHFGKLKNVICSKLEGGEITHSGIPKNPSYTVFSQGAFSYALYFDREVTDEAQFMHLEKHNTGRDYSSVWN